LHIADLTEAAQLSIGLSLMQLQTGAPGDGLEAFEIGINQLRRAGQLGIAAESMETRAERLESLGSTEEAALLRERALRWAMAARVSGR
jgi:hypothetical protein